MSDDWLLDRALARAGKRCAYRQPRLPYAVWYRTVRFDTANRDREARGDFYPRLRWLDVLAAKAKL